jgi:4-amino-4-deoxy-L-arabinose transferase-like glycosyltransferase
MITSALPRLLPAPAAGRAAVLTRRLAASPLQYRLGRFALRNYHRCVAAILTLALVNCFWRLSATVISDLDEARYGVAASEMLHNHSALIATYAGRPEYWNLKPPLGYWMEELAYHAFGSNVFALRLPSALCAVAMIALSISLCRRWYGRRSALLAGLILTTCFGLISHHGARSGDLDSALTLILLVAVIQVPKLAESAGARLLWAAAIALGFLLKSFAVLPFVLLSAIYLAWSGDWRQCRWRDWISAAMLLSGIIFGWVLARCWVDHSMYFVTRMLHEDLLARSTSVIDPERHRPWAYPLVLLDRFAPWPLLILAGALAGALRRKPVPVAAAPRHSRLLLLWAVVPLMAFSLARTQHHWYLDPIYPVLSMLAATASLNLMALPAVPGRIAAVSVLVLGLLFCEARILLRAGWTDRRPQNQVALMALQDHVLIPAGQTIQTSFALSHSERFILQVVDGYRVVEPDDPQPCASAARAGQCVLLLRRRPGAMMTAASQSGMRSVAIGADYALLTAAEQAGPVLPIARGSHRIGFLLDIRR